MNRAMEMKHLRKADTDIAEANERVARQTKLIAHLSSRGHDVGTARSFLETMHCTLLVMEEHRSLILKELDADAPPNWRKG